LLPMFNVRSSRMPRLPLFEAGFDQSGIFGERHAGHVEADAVEAKASAALRHIVEGLPSRRSKPWWRRRAARASNSRHSEPRLLSAASAADAPAKYDFKEIFSLS